MEELRRYFEKYITPVHLDNIQKNSQISGIENELIRNLLEVTAEQSTALEHITLDMDVMGSIQIPDNIEMDVFEIMCNLIDNAICELACQNPGLLRIWLRVVDGQFSIYIANTLTDGIDIKQLYSKKNSKGSGNGYGLKRIRTIVYQNPGMEHFTYKNGTYEGKEILVQNIKMDLRA